MVGSFYSESTMTHKTIAVNYTMATNIKSEGSNDLRNLLAWGRNDNTPLSQNTVPAFADIHDFDGDGLTNDLVLSFVSSPIKIVENKNVLVETFLSLAGEDPKDPYILKEIRIH